MTLPIWEYLILPYFDIDTLQINASLPLLMHMDHPERLEGVGWDWDVNSRTLGKVTGATDLQAQGKASNIFSELSGFGALPPK